MVAAILDFLAVEIFAEGLQSLGTQNSNLHVKSHHMMQKSACIKLVLGSPIVSQTIHRS